MTFYLIKIVFVKKSIHIKRQSNIFAKTYLRILFMSQFNVL